MLIKASTIVDRVYFVRAETQELMAVIYREPKNTWRVSQQTKRFEVEQSVAPIEDGPDVIALDHSAKTLRKLRSAYLDMAKKLAVQWSGKVDVLDVNGTGVDYARLMAQQPSVAIKITVIPAPPARPQ